MSANIQSQLTVCKIIVLVEFRVYKTCYVIKIQLF